jgi:two-component system phosphate regulon sensor histidine kinase PhoR
MEAVVLLDAEGVVLDLSPVAQKLFGPTATHGQTLITATRSLALDELAKHCLSGGVDCDRQITLGLAHTPYRARMAPLTPPAAGAVLVLQDLSALQRLGRARRDFVANISHELRTPIASIRLLVDTLRGNPLPADLRAQLLEKIAVENDALAQLAQELLDLAQIESGQALVRLIPLDLRALTDTLLIRFEAQAERKHQTLQLDIPPDLRVLADADHLQRAMSNLVQNAIKFTPLGGQITLRAWRAENDVVIEVADSGPGIPPAERERVFERFFRGDRARASGGTGLGLAIAKHVVEAHGGQIWVAPSDRGAVLRFTLPAE